MCWVAGMREAFRRRGEFGAWGANYMKEKEFVCRRYIGGAECAMNAEAPMHNLLRLVYSEYQAS